jgi:hypothetical protein
VKNASDSNKGATKRPRKKNAKPDGKPTGGGGFFRKYLYEILLGFIAGISLISIFILASGVLTKKGPAPETRVEEDKIPADRRLQHKRPPPLKPAPAQTPKSESAGKSDTPVPAPIPSPAPPPVAMPSAKGRIAIIIDDLGGEVEPAKKLVGLNGPITFSILPHLKRSREVAQMAHTAGLVVMLHLPMESKWKSVHPGPGALMTTQSVADITRIVAEDIAAVPYATGANNHMGSAFTEDAVRTQAALREVKKRGLFFVDSRTTPLSTAYDSAGKLKIPVAGRDVFLDNERDRKKIVEQITALARLALKKGRAIGIGHPYPQTIEALAEALPAVRAMGVEIVPVTKLLEPASAEGL